jgi:hypothetical protein
MGDDAFRANLASSLLKQRNVIHDTLYVVQATLRAIPYFEHTTANPALCDPNTVYAAIEYVRDKLPSFISFLVRDDRDDLSGQKRVAFHAVFGDVSTVVNADLKGVVLPALEALAAFHTRVVGGQEGGWMVYAVGTEGHQLPLTDAVLTSAGPLIVFLGTLERLLMSAANHAGTIAYTLRLQTFLESPAVAGSRLHSAVVLERIGPLLI